MTFSSFLKRVSGSRAVGIAKMSQMINGWHTLGNSLQCMGPILRSIAVTRRIPPSNHNPISMNSLDMRKDEYLQIGSPSIVLRWEGLKIVSNRLGVVGVQ